MALGSLQPTHLGAARPRAPKAAASPARCLARSPAAPLVVGAGRVRGASVSRPAGRAGLLVAAVVTVRGVECPEWRALEKEGWVLLDVRPPEEVERSAPDALAKVAVVGSVNAPVYVNDDSASLGNVMKQLAAFGTGGWWQGGGHMKANPEFLSTVQSKIPFTSKVVVSCQKGLRSLAAAEMLVKTGYTEVAWLSGGYDSATKADFDTTNGKDMRHGTVAGVRGVIGWTPVQQEEGNAVAGGIYKFLGYVAIFAAANFASMGVQIWQAGGIVEAFNK